MTKEEKIEKYFKILAKCKKETSQIANSFLSEDTFKILRNLDHRVLFCPRETRLLVWADEPIIYIYIEIVEVEGFKNTTEYVQFMDALEDQINKFDDNVRVFDVLSKSVG